MLVLAVDLADRLLDEIVEGDVILPSPVVEGVAVV
jgi:hypothetical protein